MGRVSSELHDVWGRSTPTRCQVHGVVRVVLGARSVGSVGERGEKGKSRKKGDDSHRILYIAEEMLIRALTTLLHLSGSADL